MKISEDCFILQILCKRWRIQLRILLFIIAGSYKNKNTPVANITAYLLEIWLQCDEWKYNMSSGEQQDLCHWHCILQIPLIGISTVALCPSSNEGKKDIGRFWSSFRGHTILTDRVLTFSSIPRVAHFYFPHQSQQKNIQVIEQRPKFTRYQLY